MHEHSEPLQQAPPLDLNGASASVTIPVSGHLLPELTCPGSLFPGNPKMLACIRFSGLQLRWLRLHEFRREHVQAACMISRLHCIATGSALREQ